MSICGYSLDPDPRRVPVHIWVLDLQIQIIRGRILQFCEISIPAGTDLDHPRVHSCSPLPSISLWFNPGRDPVLNMGSISPQPDLDDGFQPKDKDESSDNDSDAVQLQALINEEEQAHSWSNQVDDRMLELTTATIAVQINETNLA
jgi:hypothetical protein